MSRRFRTRSRGNIASTAREQGYEVTVTANTIIIERDQKHSRAWYLTWSSSGYWEVQEWRGGNDGDWDMPRQSLRDWTTVTKFIMEIIIAEETRARSGYRKLEAA